MTPQQRQQARKITVDLGPIHKQWFSYVSEHFAGNHSNAVRAALQRMMKRPPAKSETGKVPQGRPKN